LQVEFAAGLFSAKEIRSLDAKILYSENLSASKFVLNLQSILPAAGIYFLYLKGAQNYTTKIIFNP
jgi:hypothetical protein